MENNKLLSNVLRQFREKKGLTQQMLVDGVVNSSLIPPSFSVVTYGRWERGVVPIQLKKAIIIIRWLQGDIRYFYDLVVKSGGFENKLSKLQSSKFDCFLDKINEAGERTAAYGFFTDAELVVNTFINGKASGSSHFSYESIVQLQRRLLGVKKEAYQEWVAKCKDTVFTKTILLTWNDSHLISHIHYSVCNHSKLLKLMNLFPSSEANLCHAHAHADEQFLVVSSFKPFHKKWNLSSISLIINEIVNNSRIVKIYVLSDSLEYSRLLMESFNGKMVGVLRNSSYKSIVTYMIEIEIHNFLTNPKIMMIYKNSI
ncbi:helix-turn-helix transcriptional regulator [Vibrio sp. Hep-1b-8]|uniref:helix-turn-helix domain-containing protein n=1 Tax=Vibrio sp. Hep-1b-8 TaxID=2144187 RepID=UPI001110D4D7|nr:helix-turn-helix transcriptional regulator [Vibrio sp. Hep-1b-8]TMX38255.1 hypothetical protein DA100_10585 [Vibrio sp. Hep-1b-8]